VQARIGELQEPAISPATIDDIAEGACRFDRGDKDGTRAGVVAEHHLDRKLRQLYELVKRHGIGTERRPRLRFWSFSVREDEARGWGGDDALHIVAFCLECRQQLTPASCGIGQQQRWVHLVDGLPACGKRALGRAYLAFCPIGERSMPLDMLTRSQEPEDKLAAERNLRVGLAGHDPQAGFAERDPMVEPRWSGTIAVPIIVNRRVFATVGMTYFTSALDRAGVVKRYVPLRRAWPRTLP